MRYPELDLMDRSIQTEKHQWEPEHASHAYLEGFRCFGTGTSDGGNGSLKFRISVSANTPESTSDNAQTTVPSRMARRYCVWTVSG